MAHNAPAPPRIVVGVDGSDLSIHALQWALNQASATGAEVEAVYAWTVPSSYGMAPLVLGDEDIVGEAEKLLENTVDRARAEHPDVPVRRRVMHGHPAAALLERAKGADLLVVGSHGHGGFVGALVGSVSQYCVAHATCPVVVVRSAGEQ